MNLWTHIATLWTPRLLAQSGSESMSFFPPEGSSIALSVDRLYLTLVAVCGVMALLIAIAIVAFAIIYRKGSKADRSNPPIENDKLEWAWTLIPMVLFIGLFVWGAWSYFTVERPFKAADIKIYVTGKQWMWKFQHPQGQREINELHVPVGKTVRLEMTSQDVIHSLYLPDFRIKQDVLPDRYTTLWFKAIKTGTYPLLCAEYCGRDHSRMRGVVVVQSQADYANWLRSQTKAMDTMAAQGEQLYKKLGCSACHEPDAHTRAPSLHGLFGRTIVTQDGRSFTADDQYVRDSILQPRKDIVAGYDPIMPPFGGSLDDAQLMQLIQYIRSMGGPEEANQP